MLPADAELMIGITRIYTIRVNAETLSTLLISLVQNNFSQDFVSRFPCKGCTILTIREKTLRHTVVNLNTERKVKMETKQTNKSENETLYDLRIEHVQLAPTYILPRSPKVERLNRMTLLDVYHALVQRREPILKKWILANCRFNGKGAKANFAIYSIPAADLKKLDRYLAADPLQLANEAIRQEWTENRMIVIQRGKINILWKVRIAKR